jgi:CheY-specific phosphatase CheX
MDRQSQERCVEPFVSSVENLFRTMLKQSVQPQAAQQGLPDMKDKHVRAMIKLTGDVAGSVTLVMCEDAANEAVTAFVGMKMPFGSADMMDAAGELANMITGGAISRLSGLKIKIGCPQVSIGPVPGSSPFSGGPGATLMFLPFGMKTGQFVVELVMNQVGAAVKAA